MDAWTRIFLGTDACVAPVLDHRTEVDASGRARHESGFELSAAEGDEGGIPRAAPSLSRTPARDVGSSYGVDGEGFLLDPGKDTRSVLAEAGISQSEIQRLLQQGAIESNEEESKAKL